MRTPSLVAASLVLVAALACTKAEPGASPDAGTVAAAKKHAPLEDYKSYDPSADGKALVDAAVAKAKGENKRVLVMFGGNWCKWCRALDGLFASDGPVKDALAKGYVLVHVDSDSNGGLNDAWGNPFANGFPVLVVVDGEGKKLHVQETGSLEKEDKSVGHDPDKVLAFLKQWAPV